MPSRASACAWTKCAFASPAASPSAASSLGRRGDRVGRRCSACGAVSTVSWPAKQVCQARSRVASRAQKRPSSSIAPAAGPDVAGGEQRLAPVERELGARRIVGVEPIDRAAEQARRERQVVARERAAAGGGEARAARSPSALPVRVERTELAQVLVRLLEMPADRLVVLGGVADLRLDPVGERACSSARVPLSRRR